MADIYKIGVGIALSSNGAGVLGELSAGLLRVDSQVAGLIKRWDALSASMKMTVTGIAEFGAGLVLGDMVKGLADAGARIVAYQGQIQGLGKSAQDIAVDTNAAFNSQIAIHGTNAATNLKVLRELQGVTSTSEDAREILPDLLKAGVVLSSRFGGNYDDGLQALVKTAELRGDGVDPATGKISIDRLREGVHQELATLVAGGGLITPQDLLSTVQQAGPMARMDTDAGAYWRSMVTAIMDMGGRRAGTAETALGRQLIGGKMGLSTAQAMQDELHILTPGMWKKSGTGVQMDAGALKNSDVLMGPGGMGAWMTGTLIPAMKSGGFISQKDQMGELYKVFGTETARRLAALFMTSQAQIEKDAALQTAAGKQDQFGITMGTDLSANMKGMSEAWSGLMEAIGAPLVKPAIAGITQITSAINSLMAVFVSHPDLAKNLTTSMAVGSAALVGLGTKNILGGLFGGGAGPSLQTAATMLQEAAVSLGSKGIAGVGGKTLPGVSNLGAIWGVGQAVLAALPFFMNGDAAFREKYGTGNGPQVFGRGGAATSTGGRDRNPWAAGEPTYAPGTELQPGGMNGFRGALRGALGRDQSDFNKAAVGPPPPPPAVNMTITPPPPSTMTGTVTLNGSIIGQFTAAVAKAFGGFSASTASPNSGSTMLAPANGGT